MAGAMKLGIQGRSQGMRKLLQEVSDGTSGAATKVIVHVTGVGDKFTRFMFQGVGMWRWRTCREMMRFCSGDQAWVRGTSRMRKLRHLIAGQWRRLQWRRLMTVTAAAAMAFRVAWQLHQGVGGRHLAIDDFQRENLIGHLKDEVYDQGYANCIHARRDLIVRNVTQGDEFEIRGCDSSAAGSAVDLKSEKRFHSAWRKFFRSAFDCSGKFSAGRFVSSAATGE